MSQYTQFTAKIADIVPHKRDLVDVVFSERVGTVLDLLEQEKLTSVAVYGKPGGWIAAGCVELTTHNKQYIGIVSVTDLLHFVLRGSDVEERMHRPVVEAIGATNESKCLWVEPMAQYLYVAMEQFCKGTHYALTIDAAARHETAPKMISQTDVVKYLLEHVMTMPTLQHVFGEPVSTITTEDVVTVNINAPLSEGLGMLAMVRAVPVVDENGHLVSTLSMSDFRGTFSTLVGAMIPMSIHEFLVGQHNGKLVAPVTANAEDTIGYAAQRMIDHHIHRVWVLDINFPHEMKGVVTLTDIISVCFRSLLAHAPTQQHFATDTHMPGK